MYNKNELALICLNSILDFEYKHKVNVLSIVDSPSELLDCYDKFSSKIAQMLGDARENTLRHCFKECYYREILADLEERGIVCITYLSADYPAELKEISSKPLVLYAKGNTKLLSKNKFAIVGSRKTLNYALKFCQDVSNELASNDIVIVTGSADGGDRSAILGAVDSGNIISILASGHDLVYPESNRQLIDKVSKNGLVLSEYPPKYPAKPWTYPIRNRLIAGISKGVLIVSGEMKSGAKYTGDFALEFNRDVCALPYSLGVKSGELCNYYIKNGGYLVDSPKDILSLFNINIEEKPKIKLEGNEKIVYEAILDGADTANSLILATNLKIFQLSPIISSLELKGLVVKLVGNKFKVVK